MHRNGLQLQDLAIFTTNVDAENQCLINLRQLGDCGALNRQFFVGAVSARYEHHCAKVQFTLEGASPLQASW